MGLKEFMRGLARFVFAFSLLDTLIAVVWILSGLPASSVLSFVPPSLMGNVVVFVILNLLIGVFLGLPILVYKLAIMGALPMISLAILLAMALIAQSLADIEIATQISRFLRGFNGVDDWW